MLSISLSLIAVFLPLLLMGSIVGRLFREFAMTLSVAVMISLRRLADDDADDVLADPAAPGDCDRTDESTASPSAASTRCSPSIA